MRVRSASRWWCTAEVASNDGIATCSASTWRSLSTITVLPSASREETSKQTRVSADVRPVAPSPRGNVVATVAVGKARWVTWRRVSMSAFVRTGWGSSSRFACAGPCSSRLPPAPSDETRDITMRSRIGSIGGFVTCANSCLKYEKRGTAWSLSTASGVSLPIEPTGSSPASAMGASTSRRSSSV